MPSFDLHRGIIGIGSNVRPVHHVRAALLLLAGEQQILARSRFIRTAPLGFSEQADFLNGAVLLQTQLSYGELKEYLKGMERRLGRVPLVNKNGPRTIDLDIIMWDSVIVSQDYYERDFLQRAVAEVLSGNPIAGMTPRRQT